MNPLLTQPTLDSRYLTLKNHPRAPLIQSRVLDYFQANWPYPSDCAKRRDAAYDLEQWGILVCPNAADDRAELASSYIKFWFMYDDLLESMEGSKAKDSITRVIDVISGRRTPAEPVEAIIFDLCQKISSIGNDVSHRLADVLFEETCKYMIWAGDKKERGKSLADGFESYLQYRIMEGGFWFTIQLAYWELDLEIPQNLRNHPLFNRLELLAAAHEMLVNDMYSYRWEVKQAQEATTAGHNPQTGSAEQGFIIYNAVCALMLQEGVDHENVMSVLQQHISDHEARYEATLGELRKEFKDSDEELRIVEETSNALINYMTGNTIFSQIARRYNPE